MRSVEGFPHSREGGRAVAKCLSVVYAGIGILYTNATICNASERRVNKRQFPILQSPKGKASVPLSIIVVKYSDEFFHNIMVSQCVSDPLNQLIVVDNTANLFFRNLSSAILAGVEQACHDRIVIVHEDVVLSEGWQSHLEAAIRDLEQVDPDWGLLGAAGWDGAGNIQGHFSDPHGYNDRLGCDRFRQVDFVDEHLMIVRRPLAREFDPDLPSIHNIGRYLAAVARRLGLRTYVVNAPTIHKYADDRGNLIGKAADSKKIADRTSLAYTADKDCSDEYVAWAVNPDPGPDVSSERPLDGFPEHVLERLDAPLILLSRGGSGSRLLSTMATNLGVFLGNRVNASGDCLDLVLPLYRGVIRKWQCTSPWQSTLTVSEVRHASAKMLSESGKTGLWGFKLPESLLILPELQQAFPRARYVHLERDPLTTCLRRTHQTARLDNQIGRLCLPHAYRFARRPIEKILNDSPAVHMAYTTLHQLQLVHDFLESIPSHCFVRVRFEDVLSNPTECLEKLAGWLGCSVVENTIRQVVNPDRAANPHVTYDQEEIRETEGILFKLRQKMGYVGFGKVIP